jgi:hypothetical protein
LEGFEVRLGDGRIWLQELSSPGIHEYRLILRVSPEHKVQEFLVIAAGQWPSTRQVGGVIYNREDLATIGFVDDGVDQGVGTPEPDDAGS